MCWPPYRILNSMPRQPFVAEKMRWRVSLTKHSKQRGEVFQRRKLDLQPLARAAQHVNNLLPRLAQQQATLQLNGATI